jgi:hypothetical protein
VDERQAHLIAAANALRAWVHSQQAARSSVFTPLTPLHVPAYAPPAALVHAPEFVSPAFEARPASGAPLGDALAPFDQLAAEAADAGIADTPRRAPFDPAAMLRPVLRACMAMAGSAGAATLRAWKPALATCAVIALVGVGRVSWTQYGSRIKSQLRAAGEHASVFDRPAPAKDAAAPASPGTAGAGAPPAGRKIGRLVVVSTPEGARVLMDGRDRGVTPLTLDEVAAGSHTVVLRSDAGTVTRTVTVAADKTAQVNEAIFSGWVHVSAPFDLQVGEAGRGLRLDDGNQVMLTPGAHELTFENRRFGFAATRRIDVKPGDRTTVTIDVPPSKLTVNTSEPAEVTVDGAAVGSAPLSDIDIALGTREIVVTSAGGVERRQTVTVTVEPVLLDIDFTK